MHLSSDIKIETSELDIAVNLRGSWADDFSVPCLQVFNASDSRPPADCRQSLHATLTGQKPSCCKMHKS